ncbi:MAG: transketolase family protein [bacterium]|nr:transketolase family protein [bacterium]
MAKVHAAEAKEMRKVYTETMIELADANENIVALDADLTSCIGIKPFIDKYPERMFNCGIQEANMMGIAAGLSAVGKIPFVHTFGPFATRRSFDQVFLSCSYTKSNVKIAGSDPGVTAMYNGGTHMPFEDLALMRVVPEMTVFDPSDSTMLKDLMIQMADIYGVFYTRVLRKSATKIYEDGSKFEIGKAAKIRDGKDATIIANGVVMVPNAIKAADILAEEGISVRILDMFTLKPIDKTAITEAAKDTGAIITAENHNVINGLASAVSEVIVESDYLVPMGKVGVMDRFGQVGSLDCLIKEYGLTAEDIVSEVKRTIKRKK